jgi:hypothetical protein
MQQYEMQSAKQAILDREQHTGHRDLAARRAWNTLRGGAADSLGTVVVIKNIKKGDTLDVCFLTKRSYFTRTWVGTKHTVRSAALYWLTQMDKVLQEKLRNVIYNTKHEEAWNAYVRDGKKKGSFNTLVNSVAIQQAVLSFQEMPKNQVTTKLLSLLQELRGGAKEVDVGKAVMILDLDDKVVDTCLRHSAYGDWVGKTYSIQKVATSRHLLTSLMSISGFDEASSAASKQMKALIQHGIKLQEREKAAQEERTQVSNQIITARVELQNRRDLPQQEFKAAQEQAGTFMTAFKAAQKQADQYMEAFKDAQQQATDAQHEVKTNIKQAKEALDTAKQFQTQADANKQHRQAAQKAEEALDTAKQFQTQADAAMAGNKKSRKQADQYMEAFKAAQQVAQKAEQAEQAQQAAEDPNAEQEKKLVAKQKELVAKQKELVAKQKELDAEQETNSKKLNSLLQETE